MPLPERADGRFAHRRERFRKEVVELLTIRQTLAEKLGLAAQLIIRKRVDVRFESVDRIDILAEAADIAIIGRSEDALCHCGEHGIPLKTRAFRRQENFSPTRRETDRGDVRSALALVN